MSVLSNYLIAYALLAAYGIAVLRLLVRRDYQKQGSLSAGTALLQALIFFLYGGFPTLYLPQDWPQVAVKPLVHFIGITLLVAGLASLLYGMAGLGLLRSLGLGVKKLKQSGLYRRSRNPQAIACALYVIGFALLWPSWYAAGWSVLYFVLIHTMILAEEEHLLNLHGAEYAEYCQRVPRYLWPRKRADHVSA